MKTYKALQEEREGLLEAWKVEKDPIEKQKILDRGQEIRLILNVHKGCYTCDLPVHEFSPTFPFCNDACHEVWLQDNPQVDNSREGRKLPLEYIQQKLLEFAEDERKKQ